MKWRISTPLLNSLSPLSPFSSLPPPYKPIEKVLLVTKVTRYERHLMTNSIGNKESILNQLKSQFPGMWSTYQEHKKSVQVIQDTLERHGIEIKRPKNALLLHPSDLSEVDAVISAGGDGTFLDSAAVLQDVTLPLFGINTDPIRSEGRLLLPHSLPLTFLLESILSGHFSPLIRQRIRVTLNHVDGSHSVLAHRPLNDVLIAEKSSAPTLYASIGINGKEPQRLKSSGILICTGTGSTAWNYNMNKVDRCTVEKVISQYRKMEREKNKGREENSSIDYQEICEKVNEELIFDCNSTQMKYTVREPIENRVFSINTHHGCAEKISIKPLASADTYIFMDGMNHAVPLPSTTEVHFEIDPSCPLYTATI